jgi:hypothetical protein
MTCCSVVVGSLFINHSAHGSNLTGGTFFGYRELFGPQARVGHWAD